MGKERKGHENVHPDFVAAGRGERDVILGEKSKLYTIWNDPESKKLFKLWKEDGRIPERFNSWEEINKEIAAIKKKHPKIDRDVLMDKLGWSEEYTHRRNVLGNSFMNKDGLIARNIRDDINIVSEKLIHAAGERIYGKGNGHIAVAEYRAQVKENWFSLRPEEQKALREYFGTDAFKKKAFAKGHNFASLMGGDASLHNIKLQVGDLNTALKSDPRFPEILMKEWDVPSSSAQSYFNNIASSDYTVPRGILQVMSESGWIKPEALRLAESQLQSLDQQGVKYTALDIFDAVDPNTGGLDVNRIGQFPEQAVTKDVPQAQKIANLQSTTRNPQILDVTDPETGKSIFSDYERTIRFLAGDAGTNFNSHRNYNPVLNRQLIDPRVRSRLLSRGSRGFVTPEVLGVNKLAKVNLVGEIGGAILDPEVHKKLLEGDPAGAGREAVKGAVIGGATQAVLSKVGLDLSAASPALLPLAIKNVANTYSRHTTGKDLEEHVIDQDAATNSSAGSGGFLSSSFGGQGYSEHLAAGSLLSAFGVNPRDKDKPVKMTPEEREAAIFPEGSSNAAVRTFLNDPLNEIKWGTKQMTNWLRDLVQ